MVTGATAGIGEVTAMELARRGARVVLVSRYTEKCAAAAERISIETGNQGVGYFAADLSSQAEIRQLVDKFNQKYNRLDVLVNNVGAVFTSRRLSVDGIEMTLALNHLSYFQLTNLLLDVLKASAPARVVNVSSNGHFGATPDYNDLQLENGYSAYKAYGRSKFANVLFTYELARRTQDCGVTANALHPGMVQTDIGKSASWWMGLAWKLIILFIKGLPAEQGAQTSIFLASSSDVEDVTGKYFANQKAIPSDPASFDLASAQRLWELSAKMVGLQEG